MNKEKAKEYYRYLDEKYTEWYTHPKQRPAIEGKDSRRKKEIRLWERHGKIGILVIEYK